MFAQRYAQLSEAGLLPEYHKKLKPKTLVIEEAPETKEDFLVFQAKIFDFLGEGVGEEEPVRAVKILQDFDLLSACFVRVDHPEGRFLVF